MSKTKKILVTGGAGFIGSHLAERLIIEGNEVWVLDNLFTGSRKNLSTILANKKFHLVVGDVLNKKLVSEIISEIDLTYHLAAIVGVSVVVNNPLKNIFVNIEGTKNVAEASVKHGNKKVIFTSSSEVYGRNSNVGLKEDKSESIYGSTKVTRWAYGMVKAIDEHMLFGFAERGLPVAIVRYFNCYGPRGINEHYSNVIPKFIKQALRNEDITIYGDGKGTRSFCYVDDTVNGTVLAGQKLTNDVANIGSNREVSILSLAKKIKRLSGSKSRIVFIPEDKIYNRKYESAQRRVPSISKASSLLGFNPKIDLTKGLKSTILWTKSAYEN